MELTHFDQHGNAIMVDISDKEPTVREAEAAGSIYMKEECFQKAVHHRMAKGDVLAVARIAGIMAAKKTSELIPLCHIVPLTYVNVDFVLHEESHSITAVCKAGARGVTGVEMEALTGVEIALLTIYDMCKAIDKGMRITDIHLVRKTGGKSGDYRGEP